VELCARGVRSFDRAARNLLDVAAVALIRLEHGLPVVVDPSHAAGRRDLVVPLARAAMAAGADGVMVDVHPRPETALCDGAQALYGEALDELGRAVTTIPPLLGRTSATHLAG
jgi:3-deoxy-7-phosphoheptulonate synthase